MTACTEVFPSPGGSVVAKAAMDGRGQAVFLRSPDRCSGHGRQGA
jgi:hypothetical protein